MVITEKKSTFVLIHGSWHGGWCWDHTKKHITNRRYPVYAPTLSGCGERFQENEVSFIDLHSHIKDIVEFIKEKNLNNIILVGHSYAGLLLTEVSNALANRIKGLIYLDAYYVEAGKKGMDLWKPEQVEEANRLKDEGYPFGDPLDPEMLGIIDTDLKESIRKRLTPHPLATYETIVEDENFETKLIPRIYIHCTQGPLVPIFEPIKRKIKTLNWPITFFDGPHDMMITQPSELGDFLIEVTEKYLLGGNKQFERKC